MRNLTMRQLQIFSVAARHLSFVRASEELFLTQPAVSMQIRQLEESVGMPLFDKIGKKMYLTEAGRQLERTAHEVLGAIKNAQDSLAALTGLRAGLVTVALVSTAKYFVPKLIALFRQSHPEIELRITVSNRENLIQLLHNNEIDLAIMGRPPQEMDVLSFPLARHPHVIIASPDHPLAARRRIKAADLSEETFLIREEGSGTRLAMESFFSEQQIQPKRGMVMGSNETIKQAVIAGLGLGFISLHTLALELKAGELAVLDVKGMPMMRTWYAAHLRNKHLSPATAAFKEFIIAQAGPYLDSAFAETSVQVRNKLTREERRVQGGEAVKVGQ
ncbi:LysR family transcriptional regulator [Noviherbaspirillum sp.]|uniref:LysR family transcriptional regulator n=1 Tax=Noviherbaspirillum sp. TaxID=1926288 RepID=UPI0025E438CB|nr:LysR family transcriptional regulator [Noviherbaspirillum sp.]